MQVQRDFFFFRFFLKPYRLDNAMSYPAVRNRVSLIAVVAVILKQGREKGARYLFKRNGSRSRQCRPKTCIITLQGICVPSEFCNYTRIVNFRM